MNRTGTERLMPADPPVGRGTLSLQHAVANPSTKEEIGARRSDALPQQVALSEPGQSIMGKRSTAQSELNFQFFRVSLSSVSCGKKMF
jgi:hypothetical protein